MRSKRMRWAEHVSRNGENKSTYRLMMVKPEGKRALGKPRHNWVGNVKIGLGDIG
jgi:hypothetical protein